MSATQEKSKEPEKSSEPSLDAKTQPPDSGDDDEDADENIGGGVDCGPTYLLEKINVRVWIENSNKVVGQHAAKALKTCAEFAGLLHDHEVNPADVSAEGMEEQASLFAIWALYHPPKDSTAGGYAKRKTAARLNFHDYLWLAIIHLRRFDQMLAPAYTKSIKEFGQETKAFDSDSNALIQLAEALTIRLRLELIRFHHAADFPLDRTVLDTKAGTDLGSRLRVELGAVAKESKLAADPTYKEPEEPLPLFALADWKPVDQVGQFLHAASPSCVAHLAAHYSVDVGHGFVKSRSRETAPPDNGLLRLATRWVACLFTNSYLWKLYLFSDSETDSKIAAALEPLRNPFEAWVAALSRLECTEEFRTGFYTVLLQLFSPAGVVEEHSRAFGSDTTNLAPFPEIVRNGFADLDPTLKVSALFSGTMRKLTDPEPLQIMKEPPNSLIRDLYCFYRFVYMFPLEIHDSKMRGVSFRPFLFLPHDTHARLEEIRTIKSYTNPDRYARPRIIIFGGQIVVLAHNQFHRCTMFTDACLLWLHLLKNGGYESKLDDYTSVQPLLRHFYPPDPRPNSVRPAPPPPLPMAVISPAPAPPLTTTTVAVAEK